MDQSLKSQEYNCPDGHNIIMSHVRSGPKEPLPYRFVEGPWINHFQTIMSSRAQSGWTEAEVGLAMDCAKISALIDDQYEVILKEDFVISDPKGKRMQNPRFSVIRSLENRKIEILRVLNITRYGNTVEKSADAIKKLELENTFRSFLSDKPSTSLFAQ